MLTLHDCRKIDPSLSDLSDEQLGEVLRQLYETGELIFDSWHQRASSKIPDGLLLDASISSTIKL